eukprot:Nitzschia sp. Nitz4//scaffold74_size92883//32837//33357//NITZ4_004821-RA/size92883-augustus-gene-0.5-mRNA-1//1//CDS//3329557589//6929//frame0
MDIDNTSVTSSSSFSASSESFTLSKCHTHPVGCMKKAGSMGSSKAVAFDSIEILEFPVELGDNPSVHVGPPVQLGWTPDSDTILDLGWYESHRHRRRARYDLRLSSAKRVDSLLYIGYSHDQLKAVTASIAKVQRQRHRSAQL